jgi:putative salt-induced outer membrane protein
VTTIVDPDVDGSGVVARGLVSFKHKFNESPSFKSTLIEDGSNNSFGAMRAGGQHGERLALKLGYQVRHNSDVTPGKKKTDQLVTTNLVFNF